MPGVTAVIGTIDRHSTAMLLTNGYQVHVLERRENERAATLCHLKAEAVQDDLTDLNS